MKRKFRSEMNKESSGLSIQCHEVDKQHDQRAEQLHVLNHDQICDLFSRDARPLMAEIISTPNESESGDEPASQLIKM